MKYGNPLCDWFANMLELWNMHEDFSCKITVSKIVQSEKIYTRIRSCARTESLFDVELGNLSRASFEKHNKFFQKQKKSENRNFWASRLNWEWFDSRKFKRIMIRPSARAVQRPKRPSNFCYHCNKNFATKEDLKLHVQTVSRSRGRKLKFRFVFLFIIWNKIAFYIHKYRTLYDIWEFQQERSF